MAGTPLPASLIEAIAALWRVPPPGPSNLLSAPRFVHLRDTCESLFSIIKTRGGPGFALSNALRALGLPCGLVPATANLALPPETAAERLDAAFRRTQASRVYLCPLDMADDLPLLKFGPNSIRKFTTGELEALADPARLQRINSNWMFDAKRFSKFSWLVIQETYLLDREPEERAIPWFFTTFSGDWGRIEPHQERFPTAVEAALFAVLLAPWEDWVKMPLFNWRGFSVPWVYTLSDDIFCSPPPPPSPDALSWQPETEHPEHLNIKDDDAVEAPNLLNDAAWSDLTRGRQSPLFETPIAHFLVRAFLSDGVDEFLAHITTIEAALGLQSDYGGKAPPQAKRKRLGATDRVAARVSALLGTKADGEDYRRLFRLRSAFLHGRTIKDPIPGKERIVARRLRRVVNALVEAALATPGSQSRETYLLQLA
jgi:hypothetical protein